MEGNRVYLAACPDYGQAEAKLREAVAALGGMERFVRPGERILLKANLLRAAPPESAICTHPAVAAAAAKLVAEAGGTAVITDSPCGACTKRPAWPRPPPLPGRSCAMTPPPARCPSLRDGCSSRRR